MKNKNLNKNIEDSELMKINKENPFVVPRNYFNELPEIIMEKKNVKTQKETRIFSLDTRKLKSVYYVAATIIVLIAVSLFIINTGNNKSQKEIVVLSWDEVVNDNYLVYSDLNLYSVIETLVYSELDLDYSSMRETTDFSVELYSNEDTSGNTNHVMEYLIEEDVGIDQIIDL